jgi:hypothetical protein
LSIRGFRSLEALSRQGSTSRVLNLHRIFELHGRQADHAAAPFFEDRILNRAIIIKHRLRSDETYLMPRSQQVATKIVFPFDRTELRSGGQSVFVGQAGYKDVMAEVLGPETPHTKKDLALLKLLAKLPSLDPFLLKEYLLRNGYHPSDCYFEISVADMERMRSFAADQISSLINLAFSSRGEVDKDAVTRLADALLSSNADERLDPLRLTLGLEGNAFKEGVFSWKGFLYYKWQMTQATRKLNTVLGEVDLVRPIGRPDKVLLEQIDGRRVSLKKAIRGAARACNAILALYDDSFGDLVNRGKASAFRKFLLEAPYMFMELGNNMGVISHIGSFWAYRFPEGGALAMDGLEFCDMLTEFEHSLANEKGGERTWAAA